MSQKWCCKVPVAAFHLPGSHCASVWICVSVFWRCLCDHTGSSPMLHYVDVQKVNKEELMRVSIGVRCVCVYTCVRWVMNRHVFERKTIHHLHHLLRGPVITRFPSLKWLTSVPFDQPHCAITLVLLDTWSSSNQTFTSSHLNLVHFIHSIPTSARNRWLAITHSRSTSPGNLFLDLSTQPFLWIDGDVICASRANESAAMTPSCTGRDVDSLPTAVATPLAAL